MQRISVLITSSPEAMSACLEALDYCRSVLARGMTINQVFFYQAGVLHANGLVDASVTEVNFTKAWRELASDHNLPLLVCVGAASKRGIVDQKQAEQIGLAHYNVVAPFKQVGLGEFFTVLHDSDKLVQF